MSGKKFESKFAYLVCLLFSLGLLILAQPCKAQTQHRPNKFEQLNAQLKNTLPKKNKAIIGIYLTDLYNINLSKRTFDCIFWVWVNTTNKDYRIGESIDLVNAIKFKITNAYHRTLAPGLYESAAQVYATFHNTWMFYNFPYEKITLKIFIEDSELDGKLMAFIPQKQKTILSPNIHLSDWHIKSSQFITTKQHYDIGFSPTKIKTAYSRANVIIDVKHLGHRTFIKIISVLYLAFILCMCTYFIPAKNIQPRLNLILGATFSVVGFVIVLNDMLPNINYMLFSDKASLSTIIALVVSLFNILLMHQLGRSNLKRVAALLNLIIGLLVFISYVAYNLYILIPLL